MSCFFFKQKTAYEMRISDWSSDVCSSDLIQLKAENLVKVYKRRAVVDHVSFDVRQGEIVGLLGPNGAGKTTSFYMIVGLIKPNEGHVYMDGKEITEDPM